MRTIARARASTGALVVVALVIASLGACSRPDPLRDLLPACTPADLVEAVGGPDDGELRAYARANGMLPLLHIWGQFEESYDCTSSRAFVRSEEIINGPCERVGNVLATEFRMPFYLNASREIAAFRTEERMEIRRRIQQCRAALESKRPSEEMEPIRRNLAYFEKVGSLYGSSLARLTIADLCLVTGDIETHHSLLWRSLEDYRRMGNVRLQCQLLGSLGAWFLGRGQVDSMRVYWDEALRLAVEYRLPDQAPRILNFYANLYRRQGRTALAHEMYRASVDLAYEYRAEELEARFVVELADFYASLGYWDLVARLVDRAVLLVRSDPCDYMDSIPSDALRLRVLMTNGDVDKANRLFEDARARHTWLVPDKRAALCIAWAEGLLAAGQPRRAIPVIDEALELATSRADELWLLRAEATLRTRDVAAGEAALDRFASVASPKEYRRAAEWIVHDSLRLELALARGDSTLAWRRGADGLARLERYFADNDASVDGYLVADRAQRLRASLQRLVEADPWLGYGAALYWIALHRTLGGKAVAAPPDDTDPRTALSRRFAGLAQTTASGIERAGACHLTYVVVGSEVWRWTLAGGRIRRERLGMDAASLRALVADASGIVSGTTETERSASLQVLERLSAVLLPADVRAGATAAAAKTILITADGFLGAFPFETLNLEPGGYTALLSRYDVAYLRPGGKVSEAESAGEGVVFLSPDSPPQARNHYALRPALRAAPIEASVVKSLVPGALVLSGEKATKQALVSFWERSRLIYVVGHIVHDPEVPYMVLLPAAAPEEEADADDYYFDVRDVRSADLSRCSLVVLSGCSSGLPYARQGAVAPGFSHAFIDAGAQCAVHTFWDVGDQEACDLMVDFMQRRQNGMSVVHALGEARRRRMSAHRGTLSPFGWSAYAVTVGSADLVVR